MLEVRYQKFQKKSMYKKEYIKVSKFDKKRVQLCLKMNGYVREKNCKINNNVIVFALKHDLIKKDYVFQNLTFNKCSVIIFS